MTFPPAAPHTVGKSGHLVEHGVDSRHDVLAVHDDGLPAGARSADVKDGALFGAVDLLAAKHCVDPLAQPGFLCELEQQLDRLVRDAVLRVVEEQTGGLHRQALTALRIIGEQFTEMQRFDFLRVLRKSFPGRTPDQGCHDRFPRLCFCCQLKPNPLAQPGAP